MVVHAYNKQTTQKAYAGWPVVKKKAILQLHNSLVQSTGWDLCLLKNISALKLLCNFFQLV